MRQWTGSSFVQVMACRLFGAKPLPEPVVAFCLPDSWEHISAKFESWLWELIRRFSARVASPVIRESHHAHLCYDTDTIRMTKINKICADIGLYKQMKWLWIYDYLPPLSQQHNWLHLGNHCDITIMLVLLNLDNTSHWKNWQNIITLVWTVDQGAIYKMFYKNNIW